MRKGLWELRPLQVPLNTAVDVRCRALAVKREKFVEEVAQLAPKEAARPYASDLHKIVDWSLKTKIPTSNHCKRCKDCLGQTHDGGCGARE